MGDLGSKERRKDEGRVERKQGQWLQGQNRVSSLGFQGSRGRQMAPACASCCCLLPISSSRASSS